MSDTMFEEDLHEDEFEQEDYEPGEEGEEEEGEENAEPIAVIAYNGRFPGASNTEEFWTNLRDGIESVKFFTDEELADANIDPAILANPRFVRADAVLDDIELFDAGFFNYSPREAEIMDPQHRLFMECAWETMELAGYNPETYEGRVGVFGGSGLSSYLIRNLLKNSEFVDSVGSFNTMLGNSQDFLATKVSYKMNLMGPSINVNTLCSSSSVCIHLACQSLWNYGTDMNLAGGVSIQISRNEAFFYQEGGIGAFDGHCRAFDERAGGTVSGSGLGILMLKRLDDAISDGDTVHAVIRGSAINNDGSVKLSYTAPSIDGQAEVIAEALSIGGVDPATVNYVECHGTGTSLGDPVEISGLTKAFRAYTDKKGFCAVGSVKTNIGHLVTAGGVASIIKTIMALKHRKIPPSLNFERPNPKIDFANSPFFVNTELRDWESVDGEPRRAGVSSFGIGGTNAHQVLEEAPELEPTDEGRPYQLVPFSARSQEGLAAARARLADHLENNTDQNFADAAYTLQVGRKTFNYRAFLVAETREDAIAALRDEASPSVLSLFQEKSDRTAAFLFSGQGSQYIGMAKGIYETEEVFREQVDNCAEILQKHLDLDIREIMWPSEESEEATERLQRTSMTQPALFTIEVAQARLLMSWGIQPAAMIGHSIGEYAAAHLAGVFSLKDALALVSERGRLIDSLPAGDMLAVPMPEVELVAQMPPALSLAAVNGRASCVVSGQAADVAAFRDKLSAKGIEARMLHTSHAFHSSMMEPILDSFTARVKELELGEPQLPFISNVSGTWITAEQATDPSYWAKHLRGCVRFHDGLGTLLGKGDNVLVEVGPGRTLATLARQFPTGGERPTALHTIRHPREKVVDASFLQSALGQLWLAGVNVDWAEFHEGEVRRRVPMPTYPFERRKYWIAPDMMGYRSEQVSLSDEKLLGVRKQDMADWFYIPTWKSTAVPPVPVELPPKARWMIVATDDEVARQLGGRLVDEGQVLVTVSAGAAYTKLEHGIYQVRPNEREDYLTLFEDLKTEGMLPQSLAFFPDSNAPADQAFFQVLHTMAAIDKQGMEDPISLSVISQGLREVDTAEMNLSGAMVQGLLKVIPHELPNIVCRSIDTDAASGRLVEKRVAQLLAELTGDVNEEQVAYRRTRRWVRGFEASPLDKAELKLKSGGSYLILGGLREAGLQVAKHFAAKGKVKLLLTHENTPDADQQAAARAIDAQVAVLDVSDGAALAAVVTQAEEMGPLRGVIFAEGPAGRDIIKPMGELTAEDCKTHLHQVTEGLPALARALDGKELDFRVVLSSIASELAGIGLAGYASAHTYCDAFVTAQNATGDGAWTSFNWDGWLAGEERTATVGEAHAKLAVKWSEGLEALDRVIAAGAVDQIGFSTEDLPARLRKAHHELVTREQESAEQKYTVHPRPNLTNPYVAPRNETEEKIAVIWQDRLGIENVGIHDNYFDLGGDSLLVVKIRRSLQETFGTEILTSDLFEHPTVASLASYFDKEAEGVDTEQVKDRARRQQAAMDAEREQMMRSRRRRRR